RPEYPRRGRQLNYVPGAIFSHFTFPEAKTSNIRSARHRPRTGGSARPTRAPRERGDGGRHPSRVPTPLEIEPMKTLAQLASVLVAASSLVLALPASAETKTPAGHHGRHESAFPMKAEAFKKLVDGKIERMKDHLARGLAKRSLSHEQKAEIDKTLDG